MHTSPHPFDFRLLPPLPFVQPLERAARTVLGLEGLRRCYESVPRELGPAEFSASILQRLGIRVEIEGLDDARFARAGATIVVANHPYGGVEGLALIARLVRLRPDLRVLANDVLTRIPELAPVLIPINPFGGEQAMRSNRSGVRAALEWLQRGGALLAFPAGEVGHYHVGRGVVDPEWSTSVARLARHAGASVLPLWIEGGNGPLFHLSGLIHPTLRTALLPRQLLGQRGQTLRIRAGSAVSAEQLEQFGDHTRATRYLRERVELLGRCGAAPTSRALRRALVPVISAVDPGLIERELAVLPEGHLLFRHGRYDVYCTRARYIPATLREIGRLRETTFREVGEGTGAALDLDRFDEHYRHLFVWHRDDRAIAGAYRLGDVDAILAAYGRSGLYTTTLFHLDAPLLRRLQGALELGRSFVPLRYQRHVHPLHLLWRGIGCVVVQGEFRLLFGPASISNQYRPESQRLLATFLRRHAADHVSPLVRGRNPVRERAGEWEELAESMEGVAGILRELEGEERGIPVLLRHYLRLGGRVLGFNRDHAFGDAIDCLLLVDLAHTDSAILSSYIGERSASFFLARQATLSRTAISSAAVAS